MTTPAGTTGTIFNPTFLVGPLTADLPKRSDPKGTVPTGFRKFENLADNLQVDFQNSQIAVDTVDNGTLMYIPGRNAEISLTAVTHSPTWQDMLWSTGMREAIAAAATQVSVLTLSGTASASGTMLINPGGITPVSVAIASTDTAAAAATKIAAATYPGYTDAVGTGADDDVVTFTAAAAGAKGTPSVSGTPTGLTATFTTTTVGGPKVTAGIVDRTYKHYFRLIVEGDAEEGGLFPESQLVRLFGFKVTPAEEGGGGGGRGGGGGGGGRRRGGGGGGRGGGGGASPGAVPLGYAGEGANYAVALNIEFLSDPNAAAALTTAGYPSAIHDPDGRAVWYNHEIPAAVV